MNENIAAYPLVSFLHALTPLRQMQACATTGDINTLQITNRLKTNIKLVSIILDRGRFTTTYPRNSEKQLDQ